VNTVQFVEELKDDSIFLQTMADFNEDISAIDELSAMLDYEKLEGRHIRIRGGRIQVPAIDSEEGRFVLVPHEVTTGVYLGMRWKQYPSDVYPGMTENQLVHVLSTGVRYTYEDDEGNENTHSPRTFVTAADSNIQLLGQEERHDYRRLAKDGFSLRLDEIALDDTMDLNQKLLLCTKMFGEISSDASPEFSELMHQRLSYLNHLGFFNGHMFQTQYIFQRTGDEVRVLFLTEDLISSAPVLMAGFDGILRHNSDGSASMTAEKYLCLELEHPLLGIVSAPIIPGKTHLF